jgi:molybdate transport system substrate-binding protein
MPGAFVASGRAEMALHQTQELMAVPGIEVVGQLPGDLGAEFVFSAGSIRGSTGGPVGKYLLELLTSRDTIELIKTKGMEPPAR